MAERTPDSRRASCSRRGRPRKRARARGRSAATGRRKTYAQRKRDEDAATKQWKSYIRDQLDRRERVLLKVIAQMAVDEERRSERADADIKQIIFDVRDRFDAMEARAAEVAALRSTIDELRERLERLEATGKAAPLRAVG